MIVIRVIYEKLYDFIIKRDNYEIIEIECCNDLDHLIRAIYDDIMKKDKYNLKGLNAFIISSNIKMAKELDGLDEESKSRLLNTTYPSYIFNIGYQSYYHIMLFRVLSDEEYCEYILK